MSRLFYHVMQDNVGNLLFDVSGTMRVAGTGTVATIYGDAALTVPIGNPMANHPSFGSFKCYLGPGTYDFYMAKSGYTFETLTGLAGGGSMANQDASAITVGTLNTTGDVGIGGSLGIDDNLTVNGQTTLGGRVAIGNSMAANTQSIVKIDFTRATYHGLTIRAGDSDTVGAGNPVIFLNTGATGVGSIQTTATTTAYNTSSDARLKHAITALTGALGVVQALRPISHRWKADDSRGVGFLAHEVAEIVDGVVTGAPDALDAEGNIQPMQIDLSKLVPYLVSALQALAEQVTALVGVAQDAHAQTQALASRVAALEGARR